MSVGYKVCLTLYYSPFVIFSEVPLYLFFFILHVNSLNLCHCQTWWLRLCRGQWASAQVKQNQKWKTKLAVYWLPIRCKRVKVFSHSQFCSPTNPITLAISPNRVSVQLKHLYLRMNNLQIVSRVQICENFLWKLFHDLQSPDATIFLPESSLKS